MLKKITLEVLDVGGVLLTAFAALSGLFSFLVAGGSPAFDDATIVWFAPLFLSPVALVGAGLILISAFASKNRRGLVGWSAVALLVLLGVTAAVFNLTGLSTGEIELNGTFWGTTAVVVSLIFALTMLEVSGVGVFVARDILKMGSQAPAVTTG